MNDKAGLGTVSVENAVRSSLNNNNNLVDSGIGSPESGESPPITSLLFIHFVGASRCPPTSAAGAGHALPGSSLLLPPLLPCCPGHCCQDRRESRVVPNTGAEQQPPGSFRAQTRILLADSSPCNDGDTFEERSSATRSLLTTVFGLALPPPAFEVGPGA
ncbi:hypothetical protein fugu_015676 [Takifugu bimaculatus]|uniref:Uncharacterized protein n=1 Tax=Takifugu bimaculatus TaxID=433685 RepID=A0A4Z2C1F8_9TELE|nr:hypothetical protein fugu_015676 [Takifugu bimaculatus]